MNTNVFILLSLFCFFAIVEANKEKGRRLSPEELKQYIKNKPKLWNPRPLTQDQKNYYAHRTGETFNIEEYRRRFHMQSRISLNNTQSRVQGRWNNLPLSFDARENPLWRDCWGVISTVQDQSRCGNCWAVASAAVMSDRACIATFGMFTPRISAIDLTRCCLDCHTVRRNGCLGGNSEKAFEYFHRTGVVSGGRWGSNEGCHPYPFSPGTHGETYNSGSFNKKCSNHEFRTPYEESRHFGTPITHWFPTQQTIMEEIYANGPVVAVLEIHSEFYQYWVDPARTITKSIYYINQRDYPLLSDQTQIHAVRIVGWGEDLEIDDFGNFIFIPYWTVVNSWGNGWGYQGTFKILRGINEALIETSVYATQYDLTRSSLF